MEEVSLEEVEVHHLMTLDISNRVVRSLTEQVECETVLSKDSAIVLEAINHLVLLAVEEHLIVVLFYIPLLLRKYLKSHHLT